jgi:hypothetical protein
MSEAGRRSAVKQALGGIPLAARAYQDLVAGGRPPAAGFALDRLKAALPGWSGAIDQAGPHTRTGTPRRLLVVGGLSWWIEYAAALGLLLSAAGHRVDLAYTPYRRWMAAMDPFDLGRQQAYLGRVLHGLGRRIRLHDLSRGPGATLPDPLHDSIEALNRIDVQYSRQREALDLGPGGEDQPLLTLRSERNRQAASRVLRLLRTGAFDGVVIPNGSILEFGAVYRAARHVGVRVVTYEFGEQRERMWLAQDDEVMRLDTSGLWQARGTAPLLETQTQAIADLYRARRGGKLWANFGRQWQSAPGQGARSVQHDLGLDPARPVVLLCTNVVGDSMALGRQVFTTGMADWLVSTVRWFGQHTHAQLVVRVHPGELLGAGHPSAEIVRQELPDLPAHVVVIGPESPVNTYDLMELAHLGLTYTTTVGMEMAMAGIPVIVAGATHYRGRGFTHDPTSMPAYVGALEARLAEPLGRKLAPDVIDLAWRYAYRFFFEYPFTFPWHLVRFWDDVTARPFGMVLAPGTWDAYAGTLSALAGEPIDWQRRASGHG